MSLNPEVPADIVALIGASAALAISGIPFDGPVGAARVGYKDGIYLLNPGPTALGESALDLVVAGTKDAILMVESEAAELSEDVMLGAVMFGHDMMKPVIKMIEELAEEVGAPAWPVLEAPDDAALSAQIETLAHADMAEAYALKDKQSRNQRLGEIRQSVLMRLAEEQPEVLAEQANKLMDLIEKNRVRKTR